MTNGAIDAAFRILDIGAFGISIENGELGSVI
jgi:hypothetical protein